MTQNAWFTVQPRNSPTNTLCCTPSSTGCRPGRSQGRRESPGGKATPGPCLDQAE